jgi:1,4-alpha-glucan branching enzyme
MKWDMGWMHDTLDYMSMDPVHRKNHHSKLTFRNTYSFHENFILPLSHDEVVYGKGSLLRQMPGDCWQKFANLRLLLGYMYAQPGKKLLFMGGEFGQWDEWYHESGLDWHLMDQPLHRGLHQWVKDLNQLYRSEPALHEQDFNPAGFEWIDCNDALQSTLGILRRANPEDGVVAAVLNFTPVTRHNYRVGVPVDGFWKEILNSDVQDYGGSGYGNLGGVMASPFSAHGRPYSLNLILPPLAAVFLKSRGFSQEKMAEYGPEEEISVKPCQNQFSS